MADSLWTPHGDVPLGRKDPSAIWKTTSARLAAGKANGVEGTSEGSNEVVREMRLNRKANLSKTGNAGLGLGNQVSFATGRSHDPMFYWRQSNIPYDYEKEAELLKLRKYAKLIYLTHPVIASCIDVYSHWPLTGMHLESKDPEITDFYTELFFEDLDYHEFLPEVANCYWSLGEAFPMGQFNDTLGVWEDDELISPDDVKVIQSPFLKEPRFEMRVPAEIRKIVTERQPEWEYRQLVQAYPELVRFAQTEEFMPVSNVLMKHIAFKPDKFFHRGIPIIMRAFRYIYQEEMLNAAVDSIASRLYTPMILVRLGATASDMGTDVAWVPNAEDLQNFEMALDTALAADFRVLTSHFATQVDQVFGKENMPSFAEDYDRLMDRQLLAFGLSRTLLMGADGGETYAADALNRDLVSTLLSRLQRYMVKFYKARANVVAEAQGHYDYEMRGGKPYPIMEERLVIDNDGNKRIVEQPKLLIPDLKFDVMNLQDENTKRQFVESLRATGVPISMQTRLTNVGIKLEDEYEIMREEQKRLAIETQLTRKETYIDLKREGLPIPQDLKDDFEAKVINASDVADAADAAEDPEQAAMMENMPLPSEAVDPTAPTAALMPNVEDYQAQQQMDPNAPAEEPAQADLADQLGGQIIMLPGKRPPESDEQRASMPKPAMLMPKPGLGETSGSETKIGDEIVSEGANRLLSGPAPRVRPSVDPSLPWDEQPR